MLFDPIEIPDELLQAQEQGKLVVFAGAGVSMGPPSNMPNFKGLAAHIAGSHPLAAEIHNYETRLDRFLGELMRHKVDVQRLCRARIADPASKPTDLHRSLVDLFIKPEHLRIVTTNFDNHFRAVLQERGWTSDCYHAPALPLGYQFSGLVYLHGCVSRPEPLVLTDEDFGRAYLTEGWARAFLQQLFSEFTTLFVGYSHNDLPVEYLARGMSGKSIAPRFALTVSGEAGLWVSLGIKEIAFEKTPGGNPFQNLYIGVKKWAEFTKQQPTDIAERVKEIVCAPENLAPDKAQSDLLQRCLDREDSCHFFTKEAKGWRWVQWLNEQGLLAPFFDMSRRELAPPKVNLAYWLAKALLGEVSDDGLLLIEKHGGIIGRDLWSALCRELWLDEQVDWTRPLIQKWVLLLVETCPEDFMAQLSELLPKVAKAAPHTLCMVLLRRVISLRPVLTTAVDFAALMKGGDSIQAKDKAEFEVALAGDVYELETVWDYLLNQDLSDLSESLFMLLENRLREAHELYLTAERGSATYDPFCFRVHIYERDTYRTARGVSVILDFLLDIVERQSTQGPGLMPIRIESWLASRVPVLVRVGLYALHLSKGIPAPLKVKIVQDHKLVHPDIEGASHESWQILDSCYPALNASEKEALWDAVNEGPQANRPKDVPVERWEDFRQHEIDKLTWSLATKNQGCPAAKQALEKLKERQPDFRGYEGEDQVTFAGGAEAEGPRSPKSVTDLLTSPPGSQMDWLLKYKGGNPPFEESREGLLYAVGGACAQNPAWGIAMLEELGSRQVWKSDLWDAAFWRMSLPTLPQDKLNWLLKSLETHFADSPSLQGLTFLLFHSVDLSEDRRPSPENLDLMIRVSLLIWNQLKGAETAVTEGFKKEEWANRAINHPAGRIAEFWLKCCELQWRESGRRIPGFPDWLKGPLADMVEGADFASQLGRVTLGLRLRFLYHLDPSWATAQLFPKLQFSKVGEQAFLLWEPHACYGDLSRDLILVLPPIYREAFPYFRDVGNHLQTGFFRHIAGIVYSGLLDMHEDNWFRDFLTGLNDDQKAHWARQMEWSLRGAPEAHKAQLWQRWMKNYWEDRLDGRPCPILPKEAEEMPAWAFVVGQAFPEAVDLVLRGPRVHEKLGVILHKLESHEATEKYPQSVLRLLNWLLEDRSRQWMFSGDLGLVLFRLPKKKTFLPLLNSICQHLAALAYPQAAELKNQVEKEFTQE